MSFEEEYEKLKQELKKRLDKISTIDEPVEKKLDGSLFDKELRKETKRFHTELAKLKEKYGR